MFHGHKNRTLNRKQSPPNPLTSYNCFPYLYIIQILGFVPLFIYNPNSRVCELLQFDKNDDENATEWEIDAEH